MAASTAGVVELGGADELAVTSAFLDLTILLAGAGERGTAAAAHEQRLRELLDARGWAYAVVDEQDEQAAGRALQSVLHLLTAPERAAAAAGQARWRWICATCDDGECEQHGLLSRL